jgi:hypothetical protein
MKFSKRIILIAIIISGCISDPIILKTTDMGDIEFKFDNQKLPFCVPKNLPFNTLVFQLPDVEKIYNDNLFPSLAVTTSLQHENNPIYSFTVAKGDLEEFLNKISEKWGVEEDTDNKQTIRLKDKDQKAGKNDIVEFPAAIEDIYRYLYQEIGFCICNYVLYIS